MKAAARTRRNFIAMLYGAIAATPFAADAQQAGRFPKIGVLSADSPSESGNLIEADYLRVSYSERFLEYLTNSRFSIHGIF